jgi:hypothetical protein
MPCDCRQALLDAARDLLAQADRPGRKQNHAFIRARANAYGAAAGFLAHKDKLMTLTEIATVTPEIDRDRYGRPMIVPPGGGKKVPYRRCTTFVGALEDTFNLARWQQRMVAVGLADRPDLLLGVAAHREDKAKLNQLCEDALEAARGHAAATTGTAVHALTEIVDRGADLPVIPDGAAADLAAYRARTAGVEWLAIERGIVVDHLKVHGTPDRIGRFPGQPPRVWDIKTGDIEYGIGKIAMQLAMYAHGVFYDHVGASRTPMPADLDMTTGVIIHLPAGKGTCELVEVDLVAGWEGVQVAREVWDWRARKGLSRPLPPEQVQETPDLFGLIDLAADPDSLRALWAANADRWSDEHTAAAQRRIQVIQGAVA